MDSILHLTGEGKEENKETNSPHTYVDKERIQRLKRNFLPFWVRELGEQKQQHDNKSPKE
jgi:hypothetical protein